MNPREVRHNRIIELRNMALRGATRDEILARANQMKVCHATAKSYLIEVVDSIQKAHI